MVAGRDVTDMAETDPARLCATVDGVSTDVMSPGFSMLDEETLLEIASGVPVEHWTPAFAEATLALSQSCSSNRVETLVAQAWPRIEARIAGMDKLRDTIRSLKATPVTLEAYRAAGWLSVDPGNLVLVTLREAVSSGPGTPASRLDWGEANSVQFFCSTARPAYMAGDGSYIALDLITPAGATTLVTTMYLRACHPDLGSIDDPFAAAARLGYRVTETGSFQNFDALIRR